MANSMQMAIITEAGEGEEIRLPKELAMDDSELSVELPGEVIYGKHGRRPYRQDRRLEPRTITVSGKIAAEDYHQAEEIASYYRGKFVNQGQLWLKRDKNSDLFIKVECNRVTDNPFRGRFGGRLVGLTLSFQADDPFCYSEDYTLLEEDVSFTPPMTMHPITNNGDAETYPVIWIKGKTENMESTTNPKLFNYSNGRVLQYTGEVPEGYTLILHAEKKKAVMLEDNVEHSGIAQGGGEDIIILAASASDKDGAYVGQVIELVNGTGAGQYRKVHAYNGDTRVARVASAWDTQPDETSEYEIYKYAWLQGHFMHEALLGDFRKGENVVRNLSLDFMVHGWPLVPGENNIELIEDNAEDTGSMDIAVLYRERWL